jgi:hypothetical protein
VFDGRERGAAKPVRSRAWLIVAYALVALSSFTVAWPLATLGHRIQHDVWPAAYLLLPVNQVSLYFFPLAVPALAWCAARARRLNKALTLSVILMWIWVAGRVLYWYGVARNMGPHPTQAEFTSAVSYPRVTSIVVGAVGLVAQLTLAAGLLRSMHAAASGRREVGHDAAVDRL